MIVDANVLISSVDDRGRNHHTMQGWLSTALNGSSRVGLPWLSCWAFVRVATNPRVFEAPLTPAQAWDRVAKWLAAPAAWIPSPGRSHAQILGHLLVEHHITGPMVTDAVLAAIAIEHGVPVVSADSDFARFPEIRWINPLTPG